MALTIKFSITCCSWTRSPWTRGKPSANCVRTDTQLFAASARVRAITSRMASSIATASFRAGAFLTSARIRSTTSPARFPASTIRESASSTSRKFSGSALSQRRAANAHVIATEIGWFTSWVIESVNWPIVATRLAWASSLCISRYCRSRRVLSKAMVACAAKSLNKEICLSVKGCTCLRPRGSYPDYLIVFEQRHNQARSKTCVRRRDQKIIPMIAFKCCQVGDVGG